MCCCDEGFQREPHIIVFECCDSVNRPRRVHRYVCNIAAGVCCVPVSFELLDWSTG